MGMIIVKSHPQMGRKPNGQYKKPQASVEIQFTVGFTNIFVL